MRRFFEVFLFEEVPASDRRPDALYLDEVERCDLYVGLFGSDYGTEDLAILCWQNLCTLRNISNGWERGRWI